MTEIHPTPSKATIELVSIWLECKEKGITMTDLVCAYHDVPEKHISDVEVIAKVRALREKYRESDD